MDLERTLTAAVLLDPLTWAFYLRVPRSQVVLLQAYFELYEGLGTVRTVTDPEPLICIMTSTGLKDDCAAMLLSIREDVQWEIASPPQSALSEN